RTPCSAGVNSVSCNSHAPRCELALTVSLERAGISLTGDRALDRQRHAGAPALHARTRTTSARLALRLRALPALVASHSEGVARLGRRDLGRAVRHCARARVLVARAQMPACDRTQTELGATRPARRRRTRASAELGSVGVEHREYRGRADRDVL